VGKPVSANWAQKLILEAVGLGSVCCSVTEEDEQRIVFLRHVDRAEIIVDKRNGKRNVYDWEGRLVE
jgi:hypothetical protein